MKIKRINIDNFRLLKKESASNIEFKNTNIIYGLNGSGKTTLSTFLDYLSNDSKNDEIINSDFTITLDDGKKIEKDISKPLLNEKNLLNNEIRVFNQSFIEKNIKWKEGLSQILISEDIITSIEELKSYNELLDSFDKKIIEIQKKQSENDKLLANKAKQVKETHHKKLDITNYIVTNLKNDLNKIIQENFIKPTQEEFDNANKILEIEDNNLSSLTKMSTDFILSNTELEIINKILNENILIRSMKELEENSETQLFAKEGLGIYKKLNNKNCFFCGGKITETRIEELNGFFNENFTALTRKIEEKIKELDDKITNIANNVENIEEIKLFPNEELKKNYVSIELSIVKHLEEYNDFLSKIKENMVKKSQNIIFKNTINDLEGKNLTIKNINIFNSNVIDKNNILIKELKSQKEKAKLIFKNFIIYDDKNFLEENLKLDNNLEKINISKKEIKSKILLINQKIANSNVACERINEFLSYITPNLLIKKYENIDSKTGEVNEIFKLLRKSTNELAQNLSEGEKTIIAFCYFLVFLDSKEFNKDKDIVVIDDPISSLDNNYLHNIFDLIVKFFNKKERKNQIFILTHNFYFLRKIINSFKYNGLELFSINKIKNNTIVINCLEKIFKYYKSEYLYIIDSILNLNSANFEPLIFGNLIRRVLEIFLSFMVPDEIDTYKKYEVLINKNKKIKKFSYLEDLLNEFSHTNENDGVAISINKNPDIYNNKLLIDFFKFSILVNKPHVDSILKLIEKEHKDFKIYLFVKNIIKGKKDNE